MGRPEKPIEPDGPAATIAHTLRKLREDAGITYEELGKRVQYSKTALSTAANGRDFPSKDVTLAFAKGCQGDVTDVERLWDEVNASQGRPDRTVPVTRAAKRRQRRGEVDPSTATTVLEFVAQMHRLKICAGELSLRDIALRARKAGRRLPRATLNDALRGDKLPRWRVVETFVIACGDEAALDDWERAWQRIRLGSVVPDPFTGMFTARRPRTRIWRASASETPPTAPDDILALRPTPARDSHPVAEPEPAAELKALKPGDPTRLGGYDLIGLIGSGGMGRVYLGVSPAGERLAIKVLHHDLRYDVEFRKRFRRELGVARHVHGSHTAEIIDADVDGELPWIATKYISGPTLQQFVNAKGPLRGDLLRQLCTGTAEALLDIHAAGIIHRDLKPSNIMLAASGPKVVDFGISAFAGSSTLTRTGQAFGTPGFMAPEQVSGLRLTTAADMFSLACTLHFAATGRNPFGDGPAAMLFVRIITEEPDLEGCPAWLRPLLQSCLAKKPELRPTPDSFLRRLNGETWGPEQELA